MLRILYPLLSACTALLYSPHERSPGVFIIFTGSFKPVKSSKKICSLKP